MVVIIGLKTPSDENSEFGANEVNLIHDIYVVLPDDPTC